MMTSEAFDQLVAAGPPNSFASALAKPALEAISFPELMAMDIPPVQFLVDKLLPYGLTILSGPSKFGKSLLMYDLCVAVANGQSFLGRTTTQAKFLFLALEDGLSRAQLRTSQALAGALAPEGCYLVTHAPSTDEGLFIPILTMIQEVRGFRLLL